MTTNSSTLARLARTYNKLSIGAPESLWTTDFAHPCMEVEKGIIEFKVSVWDTEHRNYVVVTEDIELEEAQKRLQKLERLLKKAEDTSV